MSLPPFCVSMYVYVCLCTSMYAYVRLCKSMLNMIRLPVAAPDLPPMVLLVSVPSSLAEPASRTQTFWEKCSHSYFKKRKIQFQFSPETSNENCANSHKENDHQRHVEALLLLRRAGERSFQPLLTIRQVSTCTRRSSCLESWPGT